MDWILAYINWTVDPVIFSIGSFSVRWYGVLLATGFFLAYLTLQKVFKFENISPQLTDKLAIWTVIWTLVGLRLGHFLFYEPEFFIKAPLEVFLPIDSNWNFVGFQGLASHGGVLAIILFIIYFAWKHKMNFLWLIDRLSVVVMIAAAFVRIGNLMNHEIVGSITTFALAFNFTNGGAGVSGTLRHPAQLYEAIVYFITYFSLVFYYFKIAKGNVPPGRIVGSLLIVVFTSRFFIEFLKEVQVTKEAGMTLDIGQWLSIPFVILGITCLVYSFIHKKNIPHYIEKNIEKKNNNK